MNFSKIKWSAKDKKVSLVWSEVKATGDVIEHNLSSPDAPRPEFLIALKELQPYAAKVCECGTWGVALRPIGVTLTVNDKSGDTGCVITCLRNVTISSAPLVLNTPHLMEEAWPKGLDTAIEALIKEAELYVHGNRAQGMLPLTEGTVTIEGAGKKVTVTAEQLKRAVEKAEQEGLAR